MSNEFTRIAKTAAKAAVLLAEPDPQTETVLYGIPKGLTERYEEVLLLTKATPEKIEQVKLLAARDGFHSFRVAHVDLSVAPDFTKAVR
jgi:hypothetical protein